MTDSPVRLRRRPLRIAALAAGAMMGLAGCGSDPFAFNWLATPDTTLLYSLARPEPNLPSGFSFLSSATVRIEAPNATGTWDIAVDTRNGRLVLLPPGALGVDSRARIAALAGLQFDEVVEAPADTALYVGTNPVNVEAGTIYIIRTGQSVGSFGTRCVYYAKLEPVAIDVAGGTLTFRDVTNPVCNDRKLIPPN